MTATLLSLPIPAQKKATSSQDHKHWGQLQGSSPALCIAQAQAQTGAAQRLLNEQVQRETQTSKKEN